MATFARSLLGVFTIAPAWLLAVVSTQAEVPACGETSSVAAFVCGDPLLRELDGVLAAETADGRVSLQDRPGRLRQWERGDARWRQGERDRCAPDRQCLIPAYMKRINQLRSTLGRRPMVWRQSGDGTRLAEAPPLGEIPSLSRAGISGPRADLIGAWRGHTRCRREETTVEIVIEPGYAGHLVGYLGGWSEARTPDNPDMRGEFDVWETAEPARFVFHKTTSSRFPFAHVGVTLSEAGDRLDATFEGGVTGICDALSLGRATASESLDLLIAAVRTSPNSRWSWPYDPLAVPSPDDDLFCRKVLDWAAVSYQGRLQVAEAPPGTRRPDDPVVASFDTPEFAALFGVPFETVSDDQRQAFRYRLQRTCTNSSLVARAMQVHHSAVEILQRTRHNRERYEALLKALEQVRSTRRWMAETLERLASLGNDTAETYVRATATEAEMEMRLAVLLPGEGREFAASVAAARRRAAPVFASNRLEQASSGVPSAETLAAIDLELVRLAPVLDELEVTAATELREHAVARQDAILGALMPQERAAIDALSDGLDGLEAGRAWQARFFLGYGAYLDHPEVAAVLEAFEKVRQDAVTANAEALVDLIETASTASGLRMRMEQYLIPALDRRVPAIAEALEHRQGAFARERAVAGYSPYERRLADATGRIVVPATYPEPTEDEMALVAMREYGRFGTHQSDGSVDYGLVPETSVNLRVIGVSKDACQRHDGGYACAVRIDVDWGMSNAMRTFMGDSFQGGFMGSMMAQANARPSTVVEHLFVLTPEGWRSPTLAAAAENGITKSLTTVVDVFSGVGCALADADCEGP